MPFEALLKRLSKESTQKCLEQFHCTKNTSSIKTGIFVYVVHLNLQCLQQHLTRVGAQYLWNATVKLAPWQIEFQPIGSQQIEFWHFSLLSSTPARTQKIQGLLLTAFSGYVGVFQRDEGNFKLCN